MVPSFNGGGAGFSVVCYSSIEGKGCPLMLYVCISGCMERGAKRLREVVLACLCFVYTAPWKDPEVPGV